MTAEEPSPTATGAVDAEARRPSARGPRTRLAALAGLAVRGSDGRSVGRVRDVYQDDSGGELAALAVMPRQLSARSVLIPAAAIAELPATEGERSGDAAVVLRVTAARARAGVRPPATLHATPQLLREAAAALGLAPGGEVA